MPLFTFIMGLYVCFGNVSQKLWPRSSFELSFCKRIDRQFHNSYHNEGVMPFAFWLVLLWMKDAKFKTYELNDKESKTHISSEYSREPKYLIINLHNLNLF
jgi:hypothetical protein